MKITITLNDGSILEIKDGVFYGESSYPGMNEVLTERAKMVKDSPIYPSHDYQIGIDAAHFLGLNEDSVKIEGSPDDENETDEDGNPLIY